MEESASKNYPRENEEHSPEEHSHPITVKTFLAWHSQGRPFIKRSKQYYLMSLLIALLLEILSLLFAQYLLMLLIASFLFLSFVLASIPPHNFHYKISSEGITIEDHFFLWQELYDFYFKTVHGKDVLFVRTYALIPGELTLTLGDIHKEQVKNVLLPYLPYREVVRQTTMEKLAGFLSRNFPL